MYIKMHVFLVCIYALLLPYKKKFEIITYLYHFRVTFLLFNESKNVVPRLGGTMPNRECTEGCSK